MNNYLKIENPKIIGVLNTLKTLIQKTKYDRNVYLTDASLRELLTNKDTASLTFAVEMKQGARKLGDFLESNGYITGKHFAIDKHDILECKLKGFEDIPLSFSQTRKGKFGSSVKDESSIFGTLKQDALFRVITVNAIYYNISTDKFTDPTTCGLMDIFQKRIRASARPHLVYLADPLNMVRVISAAAELKWGIEKNTWLTIVEDAPLIKNVKMASLACEIGSILSQEKPSIAFYKLYYSGLLEYAMIEIDQMMEINAPRAADETLFMHTMNVVDKTSQNDLVARFAALFHDYGEMFKDTYGSEETSAVSAQYAELSLAELKLGEKFINQVVTVISMFDYFDAIPDRVMPSERLIRKFCNKTEGVFVSTLDVMQAENTSVTVKKKPHLVHNILQKYEEMCRKEKAQQKPKLPINGNDIMNEFNVKGEIVGLILDEITDAYYNNEAITKAECFNIARTCIKKAAL